MDGRTEPKISRTHWIVYSVIFGIGIVLAFIVARFAQPNLSNGFLGLATGLIAAGGNALLWAWAVGHERRQAKVYANSGQVEYQSLKLAAHKRIEISGVSLTGALTGFMEREYGEDLLTRMMTRSALAIRLLFCHPASPWLHERDHWENPDLGESVEFDVWVSIASACLVAKRYNQLAGGYGRDGPKLAIKLLKGYCMPAGTFRCDHDIVATPYLTCGEGANTMAIGVTDKSHPGAFGNLDENFTNLWTVAEETMVGMGRGREAILDKQLLTELIVVHYQIAVPDFLSLPCVKARNRDPNSREMRILRAAQTYCADLEGWGECGWKIPS